MTKAEAIAMLKRIQEPEAWEPQINQAAFEAFDMAIKALEQQPCEDTISRQAAIDFIDAGHLVNPNEPRWSDNEVVNFLKSRPSAQPEQRWIPVSERLPELYTFVYATCHSLVDDREDWVIETCYVPIPKEYNSRRFSDWGNIPMLNHGEAEVIAWMKWDIPEPYKAECEEHHD